MGENSEDAEFDCLSPAHFPRCDLWGLCGKKRKRGFDYRDRRFRGQVLCPSGSQVVLGKLTRQC